MDNDKLVATVHNTALENLGNVEDILRFIPGIAESKDGLIVYGKGTPEYYINGRKLHDLSELQRLDGSEIRSIELIKNPGSEYSGSARAVINIKTIRKQGEGVSLIGKSYLQLAHRPSVQEMTSINYRKINLIYLQHFNIQIFNNIKTHRINMEYLMTPRSY